MYIMLLSTIYKGYVMIMIPKAHELYELLSTMFKMHNICMYAVISLYKSILKYVTQIIIMAMHLMYPLVIIKCTVV